MFTELLIFSHELITLENWKLVFIVTKDEYLKIKSVFFNLSFPKSDNLKNWFEFIESKPETVEGFSGGSVVKNLPADAGDMGLMPGVGRSLMPQSR